MINQAKREELIKIFDNSIDLVKLEELFLYDLSPYYKEKKENTFFAKQLEYLNEENLLKHSKKNISFTGEQKKIYDEIVNKENKRIIISAPTSFGKTLLIKEYIYVVQPKTIVFLVPTNSLADELVHDFSEIYSELGYTIFDTIKDGEKICEKSIFIGTQEKYYQIYQSYNLNIDLFVIDEAYKLSDKINGSREVILNRTFIDTLAFAKQVILLLPLVNKINGIASFNFKTLRSDYSPVAKNFIQIDKEQFDLLIESKVKVNQENNLVYFNSPKDAEDFYIKKLSNINLTNILSDEWFTRVEKDFHPDWIPLNSLKKGVGIHYGPMPKFIQKKVIDLFNNGNVKTILATSSIIEGVNTPTKNIFISTSREILGGKNIIKFKNLIGRAGRLGIHKIGNIYYKDIHSKDFNKVNVPFENIEIDFTIENEIQIVEINREMEFKSYGNEIIKESNDTPYEANRNETIHYLKDSKKGKIPIDKISNLLNRYGFTLKQLVDILEYSNNENLNLFKILGKLKASDKDIFSINEIIDYRTETIEEILIELKKNEKFKNVKNAQLISTIVRMIYNSIPHRIIPALDFIIELDELNFEYNGKHLFSNKNINEAKTKKVLFYNKFIGEDVSKIEESKKIMSKLFEYGIPYFRVKKHFNQIANNVPNHFSIYDIKKVIFSNDSMKDLRIYFE